MPSFEKILSQAQDDVLTGGFRMRGFKVFLPSYLEEELERPVELVTRETLSPHLGPRILEDVEYVEIGD